MNEPWENTDCLIVLLLYYICINHTGLGLLLSRHDTMLLPLLLLLLLPFKTPLFGKRNYVKSQRKSLSKKRMVSPPEDLLDATNKKNTRRLNHNNKWKKEAECTRAWVCEHFASSSRYVSPVNLSARGSFQSKPNVKTSKPRCKVLFSLLFSYSFTFFDTVVQNRSPWHELTMLMSDRLLSQ